MIEGRLGPQPESPRLYERRLRVCTALSVSSITVELEDALDICRLSIERSALVSESAVGRCSVAARQRVVELCTHNRVHLYTTTMCCCNKCLGLTASLYFSRDFEASKFCVL